MGGGGGKRTENEEANFDWIILQLHSTMKLFFFSLQRAASTPQIFITFVSSTFALVRLSDGDVSNDSSRGERRSLNDATWGSMSTRRPEFHNKGLLYDDHVMSERGSLMYFEENKDNCHNHRDTREDQRKVK